MDIEKLKKRFPKLKINELLKNHCTFRVGGPADLFYELTLMEELPALITDIEAAGIAYRMIGRGTNTLFTDKGFRGLIIKNLTKDVKVDNTSIMADSGVLLSQILRTSLENNLTGLEPLAGLPGTIGAAVFGNAGVPGTEISSFIDTVTVFRPMEGVRELQSDALTFRYRHSSIQEGRDTIMKVGVKLTPGDKARSQELIKKIDAVRRSKQPPGFSAGSFFKNPKSDTAAGYLIEKTGMKGAKHGGAKISEKHANFFMNTGNAIAAEVLGLAKQAQQKVKESNGIDLEMEVKIIGEL